MERLVKFNDEDSTAEINITIAQEVVSKRYEELLNDYIKDIQISGFRKGRVPKQVFQKKYQKTIEGEVANKLIEESLEKAFENVGREVVRFRTPELIEINDFNSQKDFTFTLKVDVMPDLNIENYENLKAPLYKIEVDDLDMSQELERLQQQNTFTVIKEGISENGDILDVNYVELNGKDQEIPSSRRQNFVFTLGESENLYNWDEDLLGVSAQMEKIIEKQFPIDYEHKDLANKFVRIKIFVNSIKIKKMPELDDEFAQDISSNFKTLEDLKRDIKDRLSNRANELARTHRVDELLKEIFILHPFSIPEGLILSEIQFRFNQLAKQMGISEDHLLKVTGGSISGLEEKWRKESELTLRNKLILEDLIKRENISVSDDEFNKFSEKLVKEYQSGIDELKVHFGEENFKSFVKEKVKNDKILTLLSDKSGVSEFVNSSLTNFYSLNSK